jgi:hypothetical protein
MAAAAGANSVRMDLSWSSLEINGKGKYDPYYVGQVDRYMNDAAARGIKVIAMFWTTPCWASTAPDSAKQGCAGSWWNRGVDRYAPTNAADYGEAAAWVAQRWGSKMAALEVWNEPNDSAFFKSPNAVADYAALVKAAYPRVKAAAPGVPVLAGAMEFADGKFLEGLYGQGMLGFYDGISLHPYNEWRAPGDAWQEQWKQYTFTRGVPWIHDIMAAHGDATSKLWFTEMGWSSCLPGGTDKFCVTEAQQAQYTADALRIIRDRWDYVAAAIFYNLRNKGTTPTDRESSYGLIYRDFSPKPAYIAWKNVLAELNSTPGPIPIGTTPVTPPKVTPVPPAGTQTPAQKAKIEIQRKAAAKVKAKRRATARRMAAAAKRRAAAAAKRRAAAKLKAAQARRLHTRRA